MKFTGMHGITGIGINMKNTSIVGIIGIYM